MKRYWFEFNREDNHNLPAGLILGCGITAYSQQDAIALLETKVFINRSIPAFSKIVEDIDVSTLDANHILPNMKSVVHRGIWFPIGY